VFKINRFLLHIATIFETQIVDSFKKLLIEKFVVATMKKIIVIGSGFSSLSAACFLAKYGYDVTVLEKNDTLGGRARKFEVDGFMFDMGPSWYWMPDVFEKFFAAFGKKVSDYYELKRLEPSYAVVFSEDEHVHIPSNLNQLKQLFESYEKGAGQQLQAFLDDAAYKYKVGITDLVYKPSLSITEFMSPKLLLDIMRLNTFKSFAEHAREYIKNPKLLQLLEFPVLFLGATPQNTPALYSLMNYADMQLGTWYPLGGMHKIVEGMVNLAKTLGVKFETNAAVFGVINDGNKVTGVKANDKIYECDAVVAGADYHHIDKQVLSKNHSNYSDKYWDKRVMAPSSVLYYLGVNKKIKKLTHHTLFFDTDFKQHAKEIYDTKEWPSNPLFYVCTPSVTDVSVAPQNNENIFLLMPVATGLTDDTEATREKYFDMMMTRLEKYCGEKIREHIIVKKSYAQSNFINDYNSFKGNAYGLANTLMQTAILKPSLKNKHLNNFYYTGQLTSPGPGVPPAIISGEVVSNLILAEI